jgi:phosphatidylserine/phosphatidylglycerophosphate/cardiolipin synthase-like enzyme
VRPARFLTALVLVVSMLAVGAAASADDDTPTRPDIADGDTGVDPPLWGPAKSAIDESPVLANAGAVAAPRRYAPRPGVIFNTAVGTSSSKNAIYGKILAAINHAPSGSRIRIMSWNIMSQTAVDAMLRAQKRGVKLRVLMANTNLVDIPNPGFVRLRAGFKRNNQTLPMRRRSYAKTCIGSCRGDRGSAHTKVFLFSKTGKAHDVVMSGSANLTVAGAVNQWNDMFTWVDNRNMFNFAVRTYKEMWQDKPLAQQHVHHTVGKDTLGFHPLVGPDGVEPDPVMRLLNKVKCRGAKNTRHGRTVVRAAPDAIRQARGLALGLKLRELWAQGCDVRIAYTVMGIDVSRALNKPTARGVVPKKHLVQDFNGDGEFDNYFHLKAVSINGNWNGNRGAYVVLNGSSNWSSGARFSDENYAIIKRRSTTMKYQRFIDYWYVNFPKSAPVTARTARLVTRGEVDPYANIDMD